MFRAPYLLEIKLELFSEKMDVPPPHIFKLGQGHKNLIKSSSYPNVITMQIWFQSTH